MNNPYDPDQCEHWAYERGHTFGGNEKWPVYEESRLDSVAMSHVRDMWKPYARNADGKVTNHTRQAHKDHAARPDSEFADRAAAYKRGYLDGSKTRTPE